MKKVALLVLILIGLGTLAKSASLRENKSLKNAFRLLQDEAGGVVEPTEPVTSEPTAPVVDVNVSLEQTIVKPEESVQNLNGSDIPYQIQVELDQASLIPVQGEEPAVVTESSEQNPEALGDTAPSNFQEPTAEQLSNQTMDPTSPDFEPPSE